MPASWSSDFDGMHAQNAHEPPTSSRSTTATLRAALGGEMAGRLAGGTGTDDHKVEDVVHLRRVTARR